MFLLYPLAWEDCPTALLPSSHTGLQGSATYLWTLNQNLLETVGWVPLPTLDGAGGKKPIRDSRLGRPHIPESLNSETLARQNLKPLAGQ